MAQRKERSEEAFWHPKPYPSFRHLILYIENTHSLKLGTLKTDGYYGLGLGKHMTSSEPCKAWGHDFEGHRT